jgi:RinA family phage transcriptional activator
LAGGVQTGSPGNPTEKTGLKLASNPYIITTEKNIRAIEYVLNKCDEIDLKLIDLIYWKNKYTVTGAGIYLGLSKSGAYDRIGRILYLVALETGYENPVKEDAKV